MRPSWAAGRSATLIFLESRYVRRPALAGEAATTAQLNDATVDVLAAYIHMDASHGLQIMRPSHCGLTGRQLARLFREMGQARRLTVHLNANRLDEDIDLCEATSCGYGPWNLLQMVEFAQEANYIKLVRALTVNKTIECLSLAGTAMPDAASSTACQAVADFFSQNSTVRFLDISGYDSKLDEGRLGREFSRALSGMRFNKRIEHLRVRSQMLNINTRDLADAISANKTLHTLDCGGNDFKLSNFRHVIKHLEENSTIRHFSAFSEQELSRAILRSVQTAGIVTAGRRSSVMSRFRHDKSQGGAGKPLAQQLKDEWEAAVADLERILVRNQGFEGKCDSHAGQVLGASRRNSDVERVFSSAFGGLAHREFEFRRARGFHGSAYPPRLPIPELVMPAASDGLGECIMRPMTASSELAMSPLTDGVSTGGVPSPPELDSPTDREFSLGEAQNTVTVLGAT